MSENCFLQHGEIFQTVSKMHSCLYSRQGHYVVYLISFALFFFFLHCSVHLSSADCTIHCDVSDLTYAFNEILVLPNSFKTCKKIFGIIPIV